LEFCRGLSGGMLLRLPFLTSDTWNQFSRTKAG